MIGGINVKRQKIVMILACLLIVSLLPFLYFSYFTQTKQVSEKTQVLAMTEKWQDFKDQTEKNMEAIGEELPIETITEPVVEIVPAEEAEIQQSADEKNNSQPITKEIKEKVREAIKGTINLFKKDLRIVSIGDSLTEGIGDQTESGGYVGILNHTFEDNQLNITIENYGKKGNRTDQLLKRLDQDDIASAINKADIVFITIGSNDIMKVVKNNILSLTTEPFNREREEYKKRLRAIFHKMKELKPGCPYLFNWFL